MEKLKELVQISIEMPLLKEFFCLISKSARIYSPSLFKFIAEFKGAASNGFPKGEWQLLKCMGGTGEMGEWSWF